MKLNIRQIRKEKGMTLDGLAEKIGVSNGYLSEMERGVKNINSLRLEQLARALNCSPADLIGGDAGPEIGLPAEYSQLSDANRKVISDLVAVLLRGQQSS